MRSGTPTSSKGVFSRGKQRDPQGAHAEEEAPLQQPRPPGRADEVDPEEVVQERGVHQDAGSLDREGEVAVVEARRGAGDEHRLSAERLVGHVSPHDVEERVLGERTLAARRPVQQHLARVGDGDVPLGHRENPALESTASGRVAV